MTERPRHRLTAPAIMEVYRPGSRGEHWRWFEEAIEISQHDSFLPLCWSIVNNGYRDDGPDGRVLIGHDGRIWDGHHRIVAMALIDPTFAIPVDYAEEAP